MDLEACCPGLPEVEELHVVLTLGDYSLELGDPCVNCEEPESIGEHDCPEPGEHEVKAVITWPDAGKCTTTATLIVDAENGNGDDD